MQISRQYVVGSGSEIIGSPSSELVTPWKPIVCLPGLFRWGGVFLCFLLSKHPVDMSNDKPLLFVVSSVHHVLISHWDVNLFISGWKRSYNHIKWYGFPTLASNENLDTGMFSGPAWTSKCLHPALAVMYRGLSLAPSMLPGPWLVPCKPCTYCCTSWPLRYGSSP